MNKVDAFVGRRIRELRRRRGKTQSELAGAIGVKFQQVQKYEAGTNRVSASRLWAIAAALDVAIERFFDGFEDAPANGPRRAPPDRDDPVLEMEHDFRKLTESERQAVMTVVRSMANIQRTRSEQET